VITFFTRTASILVPLLLCGLAGCGARQYPSPPPTYPVKGTIRLGSQPLRGGMLNCVLISGTDIYGAVEAPAVIQPDGTFEPLLFNGVTGLYPGKWKVVVKPTAIKNGRTFRYSVPAKYTREDTTDLTFEVKEGVNSPELAMRR
jgi:hypothetical protein